MEFKSGVIKECKKLHQEDKMLSDMLATVWKLPPINIGRCRKNQMIVMKNIDKLSKKVKGVNNK